MSRTTRTNGANCCAPPSGAAPVFSRRRASESDSVSSRFSLMPPACQPSPENSARIGRNGNLSATLSPEAAYAMSILCTPRARATKSWPLRSASPSCATPSTWTLRSASASRIAGYRQRDMRCRMRFERDADFVSVRGDFGLGDRGAARHAVRRLGQVRAQFVQQIVRRKCLRARRRGDRQRSEHDRAAECRRRSAWRNAHAATNEAHDQRGEQSDQHDAQHAHEPWRRDDQTHALRRQHGSAPAQHIARADIPARLAGAGLHDGRFVVVAR